MPSYESLVDEAMQKARARMGAPKTASAPAARGSWKDEAEKVANALEGAAVAFANDGTVGGNLRAELVRDIMKVSNEGGAHPKVTESPEGTQAEAPRAGAKKILPEGLGTGASPKVTEAPEGKMSREALAQTPPANPSKSAAASLYDTIMANKGKVADVNAAQARVMDAEDKAPSRPLGQEGGAQANAALANNEAPVKATRGELHAPTRSRLSEIFANAGDTAASKASAKIVAPKASVSGNLKNASIAELVRAFQSEAAEEKGKTAAAPESTPEPKQASVLEYAALWDKAYDGSLGPEVKTAADALVQQLQAESQ